ncbi:MAG: hypothetical protein AAGE43_10020 [Pseudomonadota bacterium]
MQGSRRKLYVAVGSSVFVHVAFLFWVPDWPSAPAPVVLELELARAPAMVTGPEPAAALAPEVGAEDEAIEAEQEPGPQPEDAAPDNPAQSAATGDETELPASSETLEAAAASGSETPATILNLERPASFSDWIGDGAAEADAASVQLAFNPKMAEALRAERADAKRRALLHARRAAVYGVADDAYRREGPLGTALKRDGRCLRLEESDLEEGQRWWAGTCTESRQNAFTLDAVEYDARGRMVTD